MANKPVNNHVWICSKYNTISAHVRLGYWLYYIARNIYPIVLRIRFSGPEIVVFQLFFKEECPSGCPCESYDCQPDKKSVLVLNDQISYSNSFVLIEFDGKLSLHIQSQENSIWFIVIVKVGFKKILTLLWASIPVHRFLVQRRSMVNYLCLVVMKVMMAILLSR